MLGEDNEDTLFQATGTRKVPTKKSLPDMLNLRKFTATLEVNPADTYNLDLVLGECPDDERHRLLKVKAGFLRDNGYEPDEAAEMLRAWLTRLERYDGEISDTIKRSWAEIDQLVIVGKRSTAAGPLD